MMFILRRIGVALLIIVVLISIPACSKNENETAERIATSKVIQMAPDSISQVFIGENKELSIDAEVVLPEKDMLERVTLSFDEDAMNQLAETLILTQYENVTHPSDYQWAAIRDTESLLATLSIDTDTWSANYTNIEADLSGPYYDGEHMLSFNYITQQIAPGMNNVSGMEVANRVCECFEAYSGLSFVAYRVLAGESGDQPENGFYTVWAQGKYNGVSICPRLSNSPVGLGLNVWVSGETIFAFQNKFLLKVEKSENVDELVTLDTALEKLANSFTSFMPDGEKIYVDKIVLEYFATESSHDAFKLRPVWSFYGKGSDVFETDWVFSYFADDGTFCTAGPLFY